MQNSDKRVGDLQFPMSMASRSSISSLHRDFYLEILTRLDPLSLSKFKLVSKFWFNFISDPSFIKFYFKIRPSITGFFYQTSQNYPEKLQYVPIFSNQEIIVDPPSCLGFLDSPAILLNSCNGLLHWSVSPNQHFISNPLINRSIPLNWIFDPTEIFACGVAFDSSISDHFKVIVLMGQLTESRPFFNSFNSEPNKSLKSRVFSSEDMNWGVEIDTFMSSYKSRPYCCFKGIFLSGFLYWELKNNALLAYNVNDHVSFLIQLPVMTNVAGKSWTTLTRKMGFLEPGCLGESGKKLHFCRVIGTVLCVWEANQESLLDSDSWVHKHVVDLCDAIYRTPSNKCHESEALAFVDDCRGILLGIKKEIVVYNFQDGAVQEVCKARRIGGMPDYVQPSTFFPFVQSLALLNIPHRS